VSICLALASSAALKVPAGEGMSGVSDADDTRRLNSFNLAAVITTVANLMMSYS
jgi:hypothetical protein